jgi:hypothetical protein
VSCVHQDLIMWPRFANFSADPTTPYTTFALSFMFTLQLDAAEAPARVHAYSDTSIVSAFMASFESLQIQIQITHKQK